MANSRRSITLIEESEVGKLMAVFLDAKANGEEISEEELMAQCPSDTAREDLRERLEDCRELLRLRELLNPLEVEEAR